MRWTANKFSILLLCLGLIACSGSKEAATKKELETAFKTAFGFDPPPAISDLKAKQLWNRGVVDGGLGEWICFRSDTATFDRIVKQGFKVSREGSRNLPNFEAAPAWWKLGVPGKAPVYQRTQDDTPEDEGFFVSEYLWQDAGSGTVFYHSYSHD